jgi:hypothetical protein
MACRIVLHIVIRFSLLNSFPFHLHLHHSTLGLIPHEDFLLLFRFTRFLQVLFAIGLDTPRLHSRLLSVLLIRLALRGI